MSANFKMKSSRVNGNLHLKISGDFDGSSAWELANTIMLKHQGNGQVIINAERLGKVFPFGSAVLENLIRTRIIPGDKMVFKGERCPEIRRLCRKTLFKGNRNAMSRCSIM